MAGGRGALVQWQRVGGVSSDSATLPPPLVEALGGDSPLSSNQLL